MNKKDALWQSILNEEKQRLSSLPAEELLAMERHTFKTIKKDGVTVKYGIEHIVQKEDIEYSTKEESRTLSAQLDRTFRIPRPQREIHSFVLMASRTLFLCFYRNYFAGFTLDSTGKIIPISDDLLYAMD